MAHDAIPLQSKSLGNKATEGHMPLIFAILLQNFVHGRIYINAISSTINPDFAITYWFGVHQFWQFWRYCIYCYLSWYSTCFTYIDIAISCTTLICTYFDFLDIVVYLTKALLPLFYLLIRVVVPLF